MQFGQSFVSSPSRPRAPLPQDFDVPESATVQAAVRPTILVVEDDAEIRLTLADVLQMEGYDVVTACNGDQALPLVRELESRPLLVLLDMLMPVMSGEELLRILREESRVPRIPVVILTAMRQPHDAIIGARVCIHKPVSYATLMRVVNRLCPLPPHEGRGTG
jgi:CheY-like chemotaxis protein